MTQLFIAAINLALRWSLLSSFSAWLSQLWNSLTFLQVAAVASTLVLATGVTIEYKKQIGQLRILGWKWIRGKSTAYERCVLKKLFFHSVGPVLVVFGIGGELVFEARTFIVEDRQEDAARGTVDSLQNKADALEGKEIELNIEAAGIAARLKAASAELGVLEKDTRAQDPRWRLIEAAAPELIRQLAPFAGQKVDLFVCGDPNAPRSSRDEETMNTWGHIANLLGKDKGAKWSEVPTNLTFWPSTLSCAGIYVFVSSEATEKTMEAANALGKGLAKTLPPSPDKMPSVVNAQSSRLATDSGWESKDAPWRLVAYHPDVITVMIGVHP